MATNSLREIGTWDQPGRDPRGRYSTDAFLAVVPANTPIVAGDDARTARWWPLNALPERLAFDHADILTAALALNTAQGDGTVSVIGQEQGIDHGSMRGYRQHTYRKIPATEACGCLAAVREHQSTSKPVTKRSQKQREWYGGQYVTNGTGSQPGRRIPPPGDCPVDGCGHTATDRRQQARGWVRIHVQGSRMPARDFCSGPCATVGIALAELRMDTPASG